VQAFKKEKDCRIGNPTGDRYYSRNLEKWKEEDKGFNNRGKYDGRNGFIWVHSSSIKVASTEPMDPTEQIKIKKG
tara:strand:- start:39 stop:263 length:225 start_codon:yes stop_codon:yes gene_type:complete